MKKTGVNFFIQVICVRSLKFTLDGIDRTDFYLFRLMWYQAISNIDVEEAANRAKNRQYSRDWRKCMRHGKLNLALKFEGALA